MLRKVLKGSELLIFYIKYFKERYSMFQVTKTEIAGLKDDDLRDLIGLLCESELSSKGVNSRSITYGGNQDASDGGVDVRVNLDLDIPNGGYIPASKTIIQVKVPKMGPSSIEQEMKPNDFLRDSIKEVITQKGAYVIVSSKSNISDSEYRKRISKMKECISKIEDASENCVDFYDCGRIASWVNMYPAMKLWVKNKYGISISGWQTFSEWKRMNPEFKNEFVFDETSFMYKDDYSDGSAITLVNGINEIRRKLSINTTSVRIAGLSGVGKTRLAFSLFVKEIGENSLDSNLLIYCDVGNNPNPNPISFVQQLISLEKRAIIIVDNCIKEQHSKLAEIVKQNDSRLSLLTIEYDAKQDDIIETDNYYMVSTSDIIIERYLKNSFPEIHPANIDTIVEASGGNFRMAKYFALSIDKDKSIGVLNNSELFDRLFMKENKINEALLKTAEICSLLYSFNINDEIELLSELTDLSSDQLRRNIALLQEMQLVQSRGDMCAVLPHGLANKLCSNFLNTISAERIIDSISKKYRVLLSFSRRIKYLHDNPKTVECAIGILNDLDQFSDFNKLSRENADVLVNLMYLIPKQILNRIEIIDDPHFFSRRNNNYSKFVNILIYSSYDKTSFDQIIGVLFEFALSEIEGENSNSIRNQVDILYHMYLSGTHATIKQRLDSLEILFDMNTKESISLAFHFINELLKTENFMGHASDFGSMKRDYGYEPKTNQEIYAWYENVLDYLKDKYRSCLYMEEIKNAIASNFRSLVRRGFFDYLVIFINEVLEISSWPEIWVSIKNIKYFDKMKIPNELIKKLDKLEFDVKPSSLEDEFIVYIKHNNKLFINIDDTADDYDSISSAAFNVGVRFGEDIDYFKSKIDLIKEEKSYRAMDFGRGLVNSKSDFFEILDVIISELTPEEIINNSNLMKGLFLGISSDYEKITQALDMILQNEELKELYPFLQATYPLRKSDFQRVIQALSDSKIPITQFEYLDRYLCELDIEVVIQYLESIPKSNEGIELIVGCIFSLLRENTFDDKLNDMAAKSILMYEFEERFDNSHSSYEFEKVAKIVFKEHNLSDEVYQFFTDFKQKLLLKPISFTSVSMVFKYIITSYSFEFLDVFFEDQSYDTYFGIKQFLNSMFSNGPLFYISDSELIEWSLKNNKLREIIKFAKPFELNRESNQYSWTDFGQLIIEEVEKSVDIPLLDKLISSIYPLCWDKGIVELLESRKVLIRHLLRVKNPEIRIHSRKALIELNQRIAWEKEYFDKRASKKFDSFE